MWNKRNEHQKGARIKAGYELPSQLVKAMNDAGHKWGLSRISNYELGLRGIRIEEAKLLSRFVAASPAWLMCLDEETNLRPDEKKLLEKYRQADSRGRKTIHGIADSQSAYEGPKVGTNDK